MAVLPESSGDYHHYVFRDGRLVGEFEEMYRNSSTVPWHQDEQRDWVDVRLTIEMLRELAPFDEIHDFGSGTGHYLSFIHEKLGHPASTGFGYDLSETACEIATRNFPEFQFSVRDLTADAGTAPGLSERAAKETKSTRLFAIRGTLWYVFPKLDRVISNLSSLMGPADKLLVVQNFPPLQSSFIGKDVIPDHHALIGHFSKHFKAIRHVWYQDTLKSANDNWFIGLFSIKDSQ